MVADDRRIRIITGHYGSGKTEFAVNYVKKLRESVDGRVAIADLDIVNVYFRSREKKEELEENMFTETNGEMQWNESLLPEQPV